MAASLLKKLSFRRTTDSRSQSQTNELAALTPLFAVQTAHISAALQAKLQQRNPWKMPIGVRHPESLTAVAELQQLAMPCAIKLTSPPTKD